MEAASLKRDREILGLALSGQLGHSNASGKIQINAVTAASLNRA